ncbi:hypothetical protein D1641_10865 [Colidextribacter sp. OB.20]|uniref:M56 family metallopeptidase n=1 Tax=Colidextribacter sp. OB.20 TaxID=2304568 RepID=UPI00137188A9|nr:hypothetical protein [Colidextribacter sp. OB.20]
MRDIWSFLLQTLTASGAAVLLLIVKVLFRDKLSPRWQFAVWGILGVILLLPAGLFGRYTLLNWPFYVEALRSALTGEYGALAHVTAPVPLPALTAPRSPADWLFTLYCLGVVFFLARYVLSYVRLRLALAQGRPVADGRVKAAAEEYNLPVCPAVEVDGLPSAFICGVFKPVLALPAGAETDEKVILHELLHLKYRDAAWGLVIGFFRCLHWCNPLLWHCADLAGNDLESLCDQRVLERLEGEERRDYGRILLEMADEKYARAPGTTSMANGGRNIRRRIEAIARFKRYPAGMGLVSVCILLTLAAPLIVGSKAVGIPNHLGKIPQIIYARTVPCTTCDGAFDTYAKAVLEQRLDYRAMCAPLSEQNELIEIWRWEHALLWERAGLTDGKLSHPDTSAGYQYCNVTRVGEETCEGLLVLKLNRAPNGESWDSTAASQWMAVQTVQAEKEGGRWVVTPVDEFRAIQGDQTVYGNNSLPGLLYEGREGDFTLRIWWQTASQVNSQVSTSDWFGAYDFFNSTPKPDGEFTTWFNQDLSAEFVGDPADKGRYTSIGFSAAPMEKDGERPELQAPNHGVYGTGSSSGGGEWGSVPLSGSWGDDISFGGGGSSRAGIVDPPDAYAADLYLNGEKAGPLTLYPVEGGERYD